MYHLYVVKPIVLTVEVLGSVIKHLNLVQVLNVVYLLLEFVVIDLVVETAAG